MAMTEQEKKFEIWDIIVKCVEQVNRLKPQSDDYPGVAVLCFVYRQLSTARVDALEPKPSEPDELQRLRDQMNHLGKALAGTVGKDVREIRSTLEGIGDRLKLLEAWSERFASWSDEEHLVKSPRL